MDEAMHNKQLVRESIERVWGQQRPDELEREVERFLAPSFVDHGALPGTAPGPAGFADGVRRLLAAFPDAHNEIHDIVAEGDRVVVRWTMTGTHTGGGLGIPATGRAVRITGITMSRVVGGRIAEHWIYRDDIATLRQLGLMPAAR
ncbi:MAG TPA: ester cyclase [Kofleriaceae bacterium]|nr:ester cyclase [Kofleriaceae bacterium]